MIEFTTRACRIYFEINKVQMYYIFWLRFVILSTIRLCDRVP